MSKIYDCFTFFNSLDILEIRFNELYDVVDKFVIVEANESFKKEAKNYIFENNIERYRDFIDKIIYVKIDFPKEVDPYWACEAYQRNQILRGLVDCNFDDIIVISDCDEIPRKEVFSKHMLDNINSSLDSNFFKLQQHGRYYCFNWEDTSFKWFGSFIISYGGLMQYSPQIIRNIRFEHGIPIENGGWHFSYLEDIDKIQLKLKTASHTEYSGDEYTNTEKLTRCKEEGLMFFNEDIKLKHIPIYECDLPLYVKNNLYKFRRFIKE